MRIALAVILATILGVATGVGMAVLRIEAPPWHGDPEGLGSDPRIPATAQPGQPVPRVVVDQLEHNFGTMDVDEEKSHDFVFSNTGNATLGLAAGDTSCRCTLSRIHNGDVPPGQSTKVTVTWTPGEKIGPYRQMATILTNDPRRPWVTLTVSGRITAAVRCVPATLVFSNRISAGAPATAEVPVYCYLDKPLEILDYKLSDQETAEQFEISFARLPSDQLQKEAGARSGCLAKVTVKPGLPQGPFRQKILIRTNLEKAPAVVLPIEGTIGSDISIAGRGWDNQTGILSLGTVSGQEGAQRRLFLVVRGPHRKEVKFEPEQIVPGLLKVKLGQATPIGNGEAIQTPLIIQIPKGSHSANHVGSEQGKLGQITIKTTHPQVPKLRILLSFVVQE